MNDNSYNWYRNIPFTGEINQEIWYLQHNGQNLKYMVDVKCGKEIDIASIKAKVSYLSEIENVKKYKTYFEKCNDFIDMLNCPVCGADIEQASPVLNLWESTYYSCSICRHAYATKFPSEKALDDFYYQKTMSGDYYMQKDEIRLRINEIYAPKAKWAIDAYNKTFGCKPKTILDFGTGSGHFLDACREMGLEPFGIEKNPQMRDWCKEVFNIDLATSADELAGDEYDIVCSFNVIEHFFQPRDLISIYKDFMHQTSMAVIETPRFNSLSTEVQSLYPDQVRSIVVPYVHNHLFTDASLATLLHLCGLKPGHVWYFGQDTIDALLQIFNHCDAGDNLDVINYIMPKMQKALDTHYLSDLILIAATLS